MESAAQAPHRGRFLAVFLASFAVVFLVSYVKPTVLSSWSIKNILTPHEDLNLLSQQVDDSLASWFTTLPVVLHPIDTTAAALLKCPELHLITAPIVVVTNGSAPSRRMPSQQFLTFEGPDVTLSAAAFNAAASTLEAVLGRKMHSFTVQPTDFTAHLSQPQLQGGSRPYVIWDASSGLILMDHTLLRGGLARSQTSHMADLLADKVFSNVAAAISTLSQTSSFLTAPLAAQVLVQALAIAVPAAFASAPPLWFCVLCPAVLGLIAPLAINLGLGDLAGVICSRMQLDDDQCFDLMLGALGLGFVLSLASAVPIFFVCRLMECAHRNTSIYRSLW